MQLESIGLPFAHFINTHCQLALKHVDIGHVDWEFGKLRELPENSFVFYLEAP